MFRRGARIGPDFGPGVTPCRDSSGLPTRGSRTEFTAAAAAARVSPRPTSRHSTSDGLMPPFRAARARSTAQSGGAVESDGSLTFPPPLPLLVVLLARRLVLLLRRRHEHVRDVQLL